MKTKKFDKRRWQTFDDFGLESSPLDLNSQELSHFIYIVIFYLDRGEKNLLYLRREKS